MQKVEFREVYDAYYGRVVGLASKLIGRGRADDVAQEVFVRVTQNLQNLKDPSKLSSWVYAITLNVVRDAARMGAARGEPLSAGRSTFGRIDGESEDAVASIADTDSHSAEEQVIRREMVECYLSYVERLPPHYYEVYALSEFEDLSNEEIAGRLSLSLDTVKIRLHRARTKLYEELRRNCQCYHNERGEMMGEPKRSPPAGTEPPKDGSPPGTK